MKYSDRAEKCVVETSLSANFKCIFPSDWISGSTWRCRCIGQRGSVCGWEWSGVGREDTRSHEVPLAFPSQGSPESLVGCSSHHVLLVRSPRSSADVGYLTMGFFFVEKDSPQSCISNAEHKLFKALILFQKICSENASYVQRKMCAPSCDTKELIFAIFR